MSINNQTLFSRLPEVNISRSKFDRNFEHSTTFNFGDIIPFYIDEVLPGDTHKVRTSKVVRLQTPLSPVMDNMFLDTYYFYCPSRLLWDKWKEFNGENTSSPWAQTIEYRIPQMTAPEGGWQSGTVADYLGIPVGVECTVSALPFRAYALICNEWFRDQNNTTPIQVTTNSSNMVGSNASFSMVDYPINTEKGAMPFKAAKFHDYFTSCLPSPQKGSDISIGLTGNMPVVGNGDPFGFVTNSSTGIAKAVTSNGNITWQSQGLSNNFSEDVRIPTLLQQQQMNGTSGMVVDLSGTTAVSVNSLRLAFQTQKMLERDARGGTRYVEMLYSHFGVTSPDASLQRPEYLGGNRVPIQINQMVASATTDNSQLGSTGAYSLTTDSDFSFEKSFTEHGYIIGVMVARYAHKYQQGIERFWTRNERTDFYLPVFANIGEQPIYNREIFADGSETDNEVFGYQEAWADYRYKPSRNSGEMRTTASNGFDSWTVADEYESCPVLSSEWIFEDKTNIDRVLSVSSSVSNQLFADIYVQNDCTRPMPLHSIPGGIDHN